ncbi:hypothetical protein BGZ94_004091, partial [Podila epigama]
MGIKGLYTTLRQKGLHPPAADLQELPRNSTVEIDVMGTSSLRRMVRRLLTADYRQTTPTTTGIKLAHHVKNIFCGDGRRVVLHIDGAYNEEKKSEHDMRQELSVKTLLKLDTALQLMTIRSNQGKYTCKTTIENIKKYLAAVFTLTLNDKNEICDAMASVDPANISWFRFAGNAPIKQVLRSVPNTSTYAWYHRDAVLRTLNLRSVSQLLLLAIVSGCLPTIIRKMFRRLIKANTIEAMIEEYVEAESVKVGFPVDKNQFRLSQRVLHEMVDTPLPVVDRSNQNFLNRLHEFRGLISRRHEMARQVRSRQQGERSFYVAPHSHANQFRNYFTSKNSILRSQKVVDLNTVKIHAPPPHKTTPSAPRPRRKRQPSRKKQRQKYKSKSKGKEKAEQPYKRSLTLSTKHDHGLMKKHITKALTIGCINHAVYQTLLSKQPSDLEVPNKAKTIATSLRSM